jgi:hypothetical protein
MQMRIIYDLQMVYHVFSTEIGRYSSLADSSHGVFLALKWCKATLTAIRKWEQHSSYPGKVPNMWKNICLKTGQVKVKVTFRLTVSQH